MSTPPGFGSSHTSGKDARENETWEPQWRSFLVFEGDFLAATRFRKQSMPGLFLEPVNLGFVNVCSTIFFTN